MAALLVIAYLPGAVLFRGPWARRDLRAALPADERAFWAVVISVTTSSAVALALASIGLYRFSLVVWSDLVLAVLIAIVARFDLRLRDAPRPGRAAIVPVSIVLVAAWLYFPPAEYVMGGKDPGTYMNEGIQIAQRGTLYVRDPAVASVPRQFRDLFFPSHLNPTYYSLRFMGFFIQDPNTGEVVGQFPHLYPVSIAIGYGLNGLTGARQAVGAWAILGLLATFFLAARLLGRTAAAAATLLLAINVIVVWFARYPNAEVVMLALLGATMLALARALVDGQRFFAPLAGFMLGLLLFLRFDAVLAIGGVVLGLLAARVEGRRIGWAFWGALVPTLAMAAWYLVGPMRAYFALPVVWTENLRTTSLGVGCALAFAAYLVLVRRPGVATRLHAWGPALYASLLVLLAAYAYFVRQPAGRTALHDAMAFRTFAWYVTVPGLALAVLGLVVVCLRHFWRDPTFFTTVAVFAVFFFYKIRIVPQHFWMTRRFLPVILPATMMMIVAAVFWLCDRSGLQGLVTRASEEHNAPSLGRRRAARTAVAILVLLTVAWRFWVGTRPVLRHVEYAGLIPRLEKLSSQFADDDLVVVESRSASDVHVLALPLAYIYARNVLVLNTPRPDKVAVANFLEWARGRYREVFFLGGGGTDLLSRRIGVEAVTGERFQIPEYDSPTNAYPSGVKQKEFDYSIYRFTPPRSSAGWFTLDVGTNDDLLVVRFHAKEVQPSTGTTFRWTRDVSYVSVLGMQADTRTVTVWMSDGGRPSNVPPATVALSFDDAPLGTVAVTSDVRPYTFAIPDAVVASAAAREEPGRLKVTTNTWRPRTALGVADDRDLGVIIDRVEVR